MNPSLDHRTPALLQWLALILCVCLLAACTGGDSDPTDPTAPPSTVAAVKLSIYAATLAKGQTLEITATGVDASGATVPGRNISWTSDNSNAGVDATGKVIAGSAGTSRVSATVEGKSATATITVVAFASIQAGMLNTCAIATTGKLYCAGTTYGDWAKPEGTPVALVSLTAHSEPEGSSVAHFCGLDAGGIAYCWGSNPQGQLGVGDTNARSQPTAVSNTLRFQSLSAGQHHTCALTASGAAYCWGEGLSGQLGNGGSLSSSLPVLITDVPRFVQIASGNFHSCGLGEDGRAWCWGRNNVGQLGQGTAGGPQSVPATATGPIRFSTLAIKWNWTCGLTADGSAHCWGDNTLGQLGFSTVETCDGGKPCATSPSQVSTALRFSKLAMSQFATCASTSDRQIYCWGGDMQNQFGAASPPAACSTSGFAFGCTQTPTRGPASIAAFSGSPRSFCGITTDGVALCWGGNGMKQLGNPGVAAMTATPVVFSIDPATAP